VTAVGKTRRDLVIGFGAQVAFKGLGFVVLAVMARQLAPAEYGKLMFALSLGAMTVLVTDLGASTDLVRRVAASPSGAARQLGAVVSARLPLVAAYVVLLSAVIALTKPDALAVVALIAVYSVLKDLYRTHSSLFLGLRRIEYVVFAYGTKLVFLVGAVVLGSTVWDGGLGWMTGAHVASGLVLLLAAVFITRSRVGPVRLRWRRGLLRQVFGGSIYLFALSIMSLVHFGADAVMLAYLQPYEEVARYEAAAKLLEASQFMVRPMTLILFPLTAQFASRKQWDELRGMMHRMFAGIGGIGVGACAMMALLALPVIRLVYTSTYDASAPVLRILYLSVPGLYLATVAMFLAASMHRERKAVVIMALGVALNVVLNLAAIPRYGAVGAAWVTVVSQTVVAVWLTVDAYRAVARQPRGETPRDPHFGPALELGHE
jgi:O-antigen/teichoic acid export membrane protein